MFMEIQKSEFLETIRSRRDADTATLAAICMLNSYGLAYKVIAEMAMTAIETMILHFVFIYSPKASWRAVSPI